MKQKITPDIQELIFSSLRLKKHSAVAKEFGVSLKTIERIKRGGGTYEGYRRELRVDHVSLKNIFGVTPEVMDLPAKPKRSLWARLGLRA